MAEKTQESIQVKGKTGGRPLSIFDDVASLLDEPFSRFTRPFRRALAGRTELWAPKIDVAQQDGKLVVKADLPGVKQEDITVSLEGQRLILQAERHEERETKEADYYRCERESGKYYRAIALPEGITQQAIEASYKDGVLEVLVQLPKQAEPQVKTIPVKAK